MRTFIGLYILLFIFHVASSQVDISYLKRQADLKFKNGEYYEAMPDFEKLAIENPKNDEFAYKYGVCVAEAGKNKQKALPFLKSSLKGGYSKAAFFVGKIYFYTMTFDSAHHYLNLYVKQPNLTEKEQSDAQKWLDKLFDAMLLMNDTSKIIVSNLGSEINSPFPEYAPVVSSSHDVLYFTSRREGTKGAKKDENGQYYEDIYVSKIVDSIPQMAENSGTDINSKEHDASLALSADGNTLIFYRTDPYSGAGDFYFSTKDNEKWSFPIKLGLNINSEHSETSASISADGNTLYFTSDRPGGYGGLDIYKSQRGKNGVWGKAQNLGANVNTKYDEESPFISADEATLYFSSKGQEVNMGGFDIYASKKTGNGWSKAQNMGYPLNSVVDDLYFSTTANGRIAYFTSNRADSYGDLDIYKAQMPQANVCALMMKGYVRNPANEPVKATIEIIDRVSSKTLFKTNSESSSGAYTIILPCKKELKIVFEKGGSSAIEIVEAQETGYKEVFKIIELNE